MERVTNPDMDPEAFLIQGFAFGKMFNLMTRNVVKQPRMDNGDKMCINWNKKGISHRDCTRIHADKNTNEKGKLI